MTLKEEFIKEFGAFRKIKGTYQTKLIDGIRVIKRLYPKHYQDEYVYLIEDRFIKDKLDTEHFLFLFDDNMEVEYRFQWEDIGRRRVLHTIENICRKIKIEKLEKQMLDDLKDIPTAPTKNKILKF